MLEKSDRLIALVAEKTSHPPAIVVHVGSSSEGRKVSSADRALVALLPAERLYVCEGDPVLSTKPLIKDSFWVSPVPRLRVLVRALLAPLAATRLSVRSYVRGLDPTADA